MKLDTMFVFFLNTFKQKII